MVIYASDLAVVIYWRDYFFCYLCVCIKYHNFLFFNFHLRMWFHRVLRADDWLLFVVRVITCLIFISKVVLRCWYIQVFTDTQSFCSQCAWLCFRPNVQSKGRGRFHYFPSIAQTVSFPILLSVPSRSFFLFWYLLAVVPLHPSGICGHELILWIS